jgi:hypothetical protein
MFQHRFENLSRNGQKIDANIVSCPNPQVHSNTNQTTLSPANTMGKPKPKILHWPVFGAIGGKDPTSAHLTLKLARWSHFTIHATKNGKTIFGWRAQSFNY